MTAIVHIPKIKRNEFFFFISYGFYLIFFILYSSLFSIYLVGMPKRIIVSTCIVLLTFNELINSRESFKSILCALLFAFLAVISFLRGSMDACIFIFVYCARNIEFKKIAIFTIAIDILVFGFVILSAYFGIIDNYVFAVEIGRIRYSLGFRYVLYPQVLLFNITALTIYINKNNISWLMIIFLAMLNYLVFSQTNARLAFYMACLLILGIVVLKLSPKILEHHLGICRFMTLSYFISCAVSFIATLCYNPSSKFFSNLNSILGSRLSMGQASLIEHGISLFGKDILWVGMGLTEYGERIMQYTGYVDNLYIMMLQKYGIVLFLMYLIIQTLGVVTAFRKGDYLLLVILTILAFYNMIDNLAFHLYNNAFWFAISSLILSRQRNTTSSPDFRDDND